MKRKSISKPLVFNKKQIAAAIAAAPDTVSNAECPYDSSDTKSVEAFWAQGKVRHPGQRGQQKQSTKVAVTVRYSPAVSKTTHRELKSLAAKLDSEIDFSDLPATSESDWKAAVRGKHFKPVKRQLTVRIDSDVLEWLKSEGKGYQSRLNDILRMAMVKQTRLR